MKRTRQIELEPNVITNKRTMSTQGRQHVGKPSFTAMNEFFSDSPQRMVVVAADPTVAAAKLHPPGLVLSGSL